GELDELFVRLVRSGQLLLLRLLDGCRLFALACELPTDVFDPGTEKRRFSTIIEAVRCVAVRHRMEEERPKGRFQFHRTPPHLPSAARNLPAVELGREKLCDRDELSFSLALTRGIGHAPIRGR